MAWMGCTLPLCLLIVSVFIVNTESVSVTRAFNSLTFDNAVDIQTAPGDTSRVFVIEKKGIIQVFNRQSPTSKSAFLDIQSKVLNSGEAGLLGLAFHPNYQTNNFFYVYYFNRNSQTVVARYTASSPSIANASTEQILLTIEQPFQNHNGGQLQFGPDGYLYIATGDGGSANDPFDNGQDTNSLLGKILRIDVNRSSAPFYNIPSGNPFPSGDAPEIYYWGLRNPWRFSIDGNNIWIGDVGQNLWEEVSYASLSTPANFGWDTMEGCNCFQASSCNTNGLVQPISQYSHNVGNSITGGYVYRGTGVPDLSGLYVYADYGSGAIFGISASRAATTSNCGLTSDILVETNFAISTFGVIGGELYFADLRSSGGLYTFSTAGSTASASVLPSPSKSPTGLPSFPTTLSKSTSVPGVATIEYQLDGNYIHFRISADTTGWLGFGISSDGSMDSGGTGSDIVVAYSSNGVSRVNDYYAVVHAQPQLDETQNIFNNFAFYSGSTLIVRFSRLLSTGDTLSDRVIPVGTPFFFIAATGSTQPSNIDSFTRHALRGSVAVTIDPNSPVSTTSTKTLTATASPVVPPSTTSTRSRTSTATETSTATGTSTGTSTRTASSTNTGTTTATPSISRDPLISVSPSTTISLSSTNTRTHSPTASTTSSRTRASPSPIIITDPTPSPSNTPEPSKSSTSSGVPPPEPSKLPSASTTKTAGLPQLSTLDESSYTSLSLSDLLRSSSPASYLSCITTLFLLLLFIVQ